MCRAAVAAGILLLGPTASITRGQGLTSTWITTSGSELWSDSSNWIGGVPNSVGWTADFSTLDLTADNTVLNNTFTTVGALIFGDTTPSNNWTLDDNGTMGGNRLTLSVNFGSPTITLNNQRATLSLVLAGSQGLVKQAARLHLTGPTLSAEPRAGSGPQSTRSNIMCQITRRIGLLFGCALLFSICIWSNPAAAQISWASAKNGDFGTGANWTGGIAPGGSDTAQFNVAGTYVVSFASTQDSNNLNDLNGTVLFGLNGQTYEVGNTINIGTALSQSATLQLFNGTIESGGSGSLNIGEGGTGQIGKLIVDSGATFVGTNLAGTATIGFGGNGGNGLVQVQNGGQLHLSGTVLGNNPQETAVGTITVTGSGSTASISGGLSVGFSGTGNLNIQNDAVFNLPSNIANTIAVQLGSSGTVTMSGMGTPTWNTASGFQFGGGSGQVNVDAGVLNSSGNIFVSDTGGGTAAMTVAGGTVNVTGANLGINLGANGTLTINSGSVNVPLLNRSTGTFVFNSGTLTVTSLFVNGSAASPFTLDGGVSGGNPLMILSGSGATTSQISTLAVGNISNGTLTVQSGAVFSDNLGNVGAASGGDGIVNVTGTGSFWFNSSSVNIGQNATGTLTVTAGGQVSVGLSSVIGTNSGSVGSGTVMGIGSKWSSSGSMVVGSAGSGQLVLGDGGQVTSVGDASIGQFATGNGGVTISGAGSTWTNTAGGLYIGGTSAGTAGVGNLTINSGGTVSVSGQTKIWNGGGTLTINGGTLRTGSFTRLNTFNFYDGTLIINGGNLNNGSSATALTIAGNTSTAQPALELLAGASTSNVSTLTVGGNGLGSVLLSASQLTTTSDVSIGTTGYSSGTVTLTGSGAGLTVGGNLSLGVSAGSSGTLTIGPGATANVAGALSFGSGGAINMNGGALQFASLNPQGGSVNFNAGIVTLSNTITHAATLGDAELSALLGGAHNLTAGQTITSGGLSFTLTIGANLNINGGTLSPDTLQNNASLQVIQGTASGDTALANNGSILMAGNLAVLSGGTLTNNSGALISGTGTINNNLINAVGGTIRATGSERLVFAGGANTNSGNIDLVGGTLEFRQSFTNAAGAAISGYGSLITSSAAPGGLGIANNGVMQFSGGNTAIRGDVNNNAGGQIFTFGGSVTTFFDDVHNDGSIYTFTGARTVFFGGYSGAGTQPGGGTNEFVGDTRPGNSPAVMQIGGNGVFDSPARLFIELGGTAPGTQFDQVHVAGQLALGGMLNVSLINGFSPAVGNSFDILDWGTLSGTFASVQLPDLGGRIVWDSSQLYATGTLSVQNTFYAGDINRDSRVDVADVSAMLSALSDLSKYQSTNNLTAAQLVLVGDLTGDGQVNNADLQGLINLLANGGGSGSLTAVPEPSGMVLAGIAALTASTLRGWRRNRPSIPLSA
jgi:T5SS/PEP-CTERM-associated repeat protein